jgi:hypothetical protein
MTAPFCAAVVETAGAAVCGFEELPGEEPSPLAQPMGSRRAAASVHQILNCDEPAMELIFPYVSTGISILPPGCDPIYPVCLRRRYDCIRSKAKDPSPLRMVRLSQH